MLRGGRGVFFLPFILFLFMPLVVHEDPPSISTHNPKQNRSENEQRWASKRARLFVYITESETDQKYGDCRQPVAQITNMDHRKDEACPNVAEPGLDRTAKQHFLTKRYNSADHHNV